MAEVQGPVEPDAPEPLAEPAEGADAPVKEKAVKIMLPPYLTAPEDLEPFGVQVGTIIMTPLGLKGTVMGARVMLDPASGEDEPSRIWVKYHNGLEAPVEPYAGTGTLASQGYVTCHQAEHMLRDAQLLQDAYAAWEKKEREPPPPPPDPKKKDAKKKK